MSVCFVNNKPIRPGRRHPQSLVGSCFCCGTGPLHPARPGVASECGCSFVRENALLCRPCAMAYDFVVHSNSRIAGGPAPAIFAYCVALWTRGERAKRMVYAAADKEEGTVKKRDLKAKIDALEDESDESAHRSYVLERAIREALDPISKRRAGEAKKILTDALNDVGLDDLFAEAVVIDREEP